MVDHTLPLVKPYRQIHFQNMRLDVTEHDRWSVWLLEINSNKFYIEFTVNEGWIIAEFQIFWAKWYFELTLTVIKMIRNIVQNLYLLDQTS